jgi:predicted 3-demethylubiquinone-9 3-methyltransferase (glyoxalase superfamily)
LVQGNGSAALEFNHCVFPDTKAEEIECYGPREAGSEGPIKLARFSISGQCVPCTDSSIIKERLLIHAFLFVFVERHSENQVRSLNDVLKESRQELIQ